jgi:hypothetical protein
LPARWRGRHGSLVGFGFHGSVSGVI